ncbi:MAG TPA: hypothetical protein VE645_12585 [Pseudonocardiaceae bacterium]|jgi:hypothetical protein|nr:hypothetical protein [Pseudonocardiaceae bacterium]
MTTLVIARAQQVIDTVLAVLRGDGFDAEGTTADDEALTRLASGEVMTVVIGGGVESSSRQVLRQVCTTHDVSVIEGALGDRDVTTYVQQEIEPFLRKGSSAA